ESATRQEKIIGRIFYNNKGKCYGPSEMHDMQGFEWPITSTRRAFSNLSEKKEVKENGVVVKVYPPILIQTDETRITKHGRMEHKWCWHKGKVQTVQQSMFEEQPKSRAYIL